MHPDYRRYNKTLHQLDPEVAQAARLVRCRGLVGDRGSVRDRVTKALTINAGGVDGAL